MCSHRELLCDKAAEDLGTHAWSKLSFVLPHNAEDPLTVSTGMKLDWTRIPSITFASFLNLGHPWHLSGGQCIKAVHLSSDSWATYCGLQCVLAAVCVMCISSVILWHSWLASGHLACEISYLQTLIVVPVLTCDEHRIQVAKQKVKAVAVILVVAMCDGHAVSRS